MNPLSKFNAILSLSISIFLITGCEQAPPLKHNSNPAIESSATKQNNQIDETAHKLAPFKLTDHQSKPFSNKQLTGKWSFIFIGYTSCPDICPTTMMELNFVYPELKALTEQTVQVIFVSADPMRDNVERIAAYLNYFNQEFIALRGDHRDLFPFVRDLGMIYSVVDEKRDDYYMVDHSASIALINPNGELEQLIKPTANSDGILTVDGEKLIKTFSKVVKNAKKP